MKNHITCFKQPKYAVMIIQKDFNSVLDNCWHPDVVLMSSRKSICCPDVNNDNDIIQTGYIFWSIKIMEFDVNVSSILNQLFSMPSASLF